MIWIILGVCALGGLAGWLLARRPAERVPAVLSDPRVRDYIDRAVAWERRGGDLDDRRDVDAAWEAIPPALLCNSGYREIYLAIELAAAQERTR